MHSPEGGFIGRIVEYIDNDYRENCQKFGLIFGIPVEAMTVQRTWKHGIRAGLFTEMGSSAADCIYTRIGAFGLTMVSDFLEKKMPVLA